MNKVKTFKNISHSVVLCIQSPWDLRRHGNVHLLTNRTVAGRDKRRWLINEEIKQETPSDSHFYDDIIPFVSGFINNCVMILL